MANFFEKLFGVKKDATKSEEQTTVKFIHELAEKIIDYGRFDLAVQVATDTASGEVVVEFSGPDEGLLKEKDGQLLDAFQLFFKRSLQHQRPDDRTCVRVDSNGFREESNQSLLDQADRLRQAAVDKKRPVYFRALPPRDRKIVHQYLAEDMRIRSRSVGDGLYKKIKIYPVEGAEQNSPDANPA